MRIRSNEELAAEQEDLAVEATRRAANVTSPNPREAAASVKHYQDRATAHTNKARALRRPCPLVRT
ncbi:hypothetical protein ACFVRD_33060 [Streptomyces sp. NPDC057908]|uniref:hypothetical protein n=1 Tax=unclassified Streptomyces TaxID=2593676 RepID=UPI0036823D80